MADVKLVASGAGAAALTCLDLLVSIGLPAENVWVTDIAGVVYAGRTELMDPRKARYAKETNARTLAEIIPGADLFLGLSAGNVLKPEMLATMAERPLVMALANPDPEIMPEVAKATRPDAIVATGRSDYPNQVNNVLCFPFIFRGALDVGATAINKEMELAAVEALAELARVEASEVVAAAYGGAAPVFGPDYIIPKPFDPRLILSIAPGVAEAAMRTGVARRPIADFGAYRRDLERFVFRSGQLMRPVFESARKNPKRIAYAEGEDERVLRAVQTLIDDRIAQPVLIGRRAMIEARVREMGLRMDLQEQVRILDPSADDDVFAPLVKTYQHLVGRRGAPPAAAERRLRTHMTVAAAMLLHSGQVDAAICGGTGDWWRHMQYALPAIDRRPEVTRIYALSCLILQGGALFLCDTYMNVDPTAEQVAEMTMLAADAVRGFGLTPKAALCSHSSFGSSNSPTARKMRQALALLRDRAPELEVDGEMHADAALSEAIRTRAVPDSRLSGTANLLVMPTLDAANISFNLLKAAADALPIGPLLLGLSRPLHILVPSVTARGIVNVSAVAAIQAAAGGGA
jgi:malate dehydrogenase (oxaloacetate-decarboxylating)(NADP+)